MSWRSSARRLLFGFGAPYYDWITSQGAWLEHCGQLAERLPMAGPAERPRVLDLGIGPGVSGFGMLEARPDLRITGFDLSAPMLGRAARSAAARGVDLDLVRGDAARLPFAAGSFDAAAQHSFLYLVDDREAVLDEVHRVLRPGGTYVMLEPARRSQVARIPFMPGGVRLKMSMAAWRVVSRGFGRFHPEELETLLAAHGFADVRIEATLAGLGLLATARRP